CLPNAERIKLPPMKTFSLAAAFSLVLFFMPHLRAADSEWSPEANMDHQLFPSLLISTASVRPVEEDDEEAEAPDPSLLGDRFGLVGISIHSPEAGTKVKVTLKANDLMNESVWEGELPDADEDYYISPKVNYKFDHLRKMTQQVPLNVDFVVEIDGESAGDKVETLQVRSLNDCPFGVSNDEETIDDENFVSGAAPLGWMFAAYVNENHPMLDKILKEALDTKIVNAFLHYQTENEADVLKQVFAVWAALQKRGIKYSSTTKTPGGSDVVYSQYIRFVDQSINNTQANCADGSVLFASILRKLSIKPFLVMVPGHMYIGFFTKPDKSSLVGLETTVIGASGGTDEAKQGEPPALSELREKLDEKTKESKAWGTFARAIQIASGDIAQNADKFGAGNPGFQIIDLDEAREEGIMPIPAGQ
ncbi:MAG TPA: hypothetical protein VIU85_10125, partial [Chthoniobacterales bacterium]